MKKNNFFLLFIYLNIYFMSNKEILKTLLEKILNNNLTILEKKNEIELNDIKYCKENIKNFESKNLFKFKIFYRKFK